MLKKLQTLIGDENMTEEEKNKKLMVITKEMLTKDNLVKGGFKVLAANKYVGGATAALSGGAKAGFSATAGIAFSGLILTAKTGLDYRKMKNGDITEKEMKKRVKLRSVKAAGGVLGGASGVTAGFVLGSIMIPIPVLGGIIGALAGGFGG